MNTYTPGPWRVSEKDEDRVVDHNGYVVAECCGYKHNHNGKGDRALNAQLIAKAPKMFEALKRLSASEPFKELDALDSNQAVDTELEARMHFARCIFEEVKEGIS